MLEVIILLSNKLYVPSKIVDLNIHSFSMIRRKMHQKLKQKTYHANANVNFMEGNVIKSKVK